MAGSASGPARERTPFGLWSVNAQREELAQARELNFTRRYESHWENFDHRVELDTQAAVPCLSCSGMYRGEAAA